MRPRPPRNVECPNCGASLPWNRLACPECGSDAETGWKSAEDIEYEAVDLPEPFAETPPPRTVWPLVVTVTAVVLIVALLVVALVRSR